MELEWLGLVSSYFQSHTLVRSEFVLLTRTDFTGEHQNGQNIMLFDKGVGIVDTTLHMWPRSDKQCDSRRAGAKQYIDIGSDSDSDQRYYGR